MTGILIENSSTPAGEKRTQQVPRFVSEQAALHVYPVVVPIRKQRIEDAACSSGFRIGGGKDHARETGMHDGTCAHDTGFERRVQRRSREPIIAEFAPGVAQRGDFSVRGRVVPADIVVPALAHDFAVEHEYRANWNLGMLICGVLRKVQRATHEALIIGRERAHSHSMVAGGFPLTSYTTREMPRSSLMMRLDTLPRKS